MKKGGYTVLNAIPYPDDITESFDVEYYCDDPAVELETFGNKCIVKGVRDRLQLFLLCRRAERLSGFVK